MGNAYWAGALPGLLMATGVSFAALRLLGPRHIKHIVWLVPALHFGGAFIVGPALSLAYGRIFIPAAGTAAPLAWVVTLLAAGAALGARAWVAGGESRTVRAAAWTAIPALAAVLIPVAYHLIAG